MEDLIKTQHYSSVEEYLLERIALLENENQLLCKQVCESNTYADKNVRYLYAVKDLATGDIIMNSRGGFYKEYEYAEKKTKVLNMKNNINKTCRYIVMRYKFIEENTMKS
ncbi:hypothetical protein H8S37_04120 [Mediterraneibacter sp. NSJ-55]|uniref:Uncharacterized protein n=1 Tax=Mediterraneibacter hominis TaxID=2763054 RepID=A0A923LHH8_9FIRM|nr:hypothetical protein [Mediterraneibacter hominis]MBC5688119.1 hypothetical protein [Mediterraneibacter hominis]